MEERLKEYNGKKAEIKRLKYENKKLEREEYGVSGGVSHPERPLRHRFAGAGHLPASAGGGAAADLPLRPCAGNDAQGCFQRSAHHAGLCAHPAAVGLCARVAGPRQRVRHPAQPLCPAHGRDAGGRLHRAGRGVRHLARTGPQAAEIPEK